MQVYVKGDPAAKKLGDCPFCHRVLLSLEAKSAPYSNEYIDFAHKPDWLQARSGGKVPLIHLQSSDFWLPDSDDIAKWVEQQYPSPSLKSDVPADVTGSFFGAFRGYLTAAKGSEEEPAKRAALDAELKKIDAYLAAPGRGPLFGGAALNETDAAFAPKLYHAVVALGHWKGWAMDAAMYPALARYWSAVTALPAWKATDYGAEAIIKGWGAHMGTA